MSYYKPIKNIQPIEVRTRTIDRLLALRKKIAKEVPPKKARETLLLATWNIREFKDNRLPESYHYIAEIIDAFDFVAVQEVSTNMKGLEQVMHLLGPNWDYIVTDATQGSAGGGERMAFLFDKSKIRFKNIAGEVVLPPNLKMDENALQFARTPFLAAFQAGWFKFTICTVHIFYGETSANSVGMKRRVAEIKTIGDWLAKKSKNEDSNFILLGDFNIEDPKHQTMKALESTGFYIPPELRDKPSDLAETKYYDQIAFKVRDEDLVVFNKTNGQAGTFRFSDVVMKESDLETYQPFFPPDTVKDMDAKKLKSYYLSKWRTYQLSDHFPLWVELKIDFSDKYLEGLKEEALVAKEVEKEG